MGPRLSGARGACCAARLLWRARAALEVHPKMALTKTSMAILNTLCTDTFDKATLVAARCSEFAL